MRRFTRLTNGFSKKVENHAHAISLHFMHYNFARPHQTLTKRYGRPRRPRWRRDRRPPVVAHSDRRTAGLAAPQGGEPLAVFVGVDLAAGESFGQ